MRTGRRPFEGGDDADVQQRGIIGRGATETYENEARVFCSVQRDGYLCPLRSRGYVSHCGKEGSGRCTGRIVEN